MLHHRGQGEKHWGRSRGGGTGRNCGKSTSYGFCRKGSARQGKQA